MLSSSERRASIPSTASAPLLALPLYMAYLLRTNFNNYYTCNVPPLEAIRSSMQGILGHAVTSILYVVIVTIIDLLFVAGAYWFYRLIRKLLTIGKKVSVS